MAEIKPHPSPSRRITASAKLIVVCCRTNGTLPTVASAPGSEEEQLYRALKRIRLLHRQVKLEASATKFLDKRIPGWANGHSYNSERLWQQRRDELVRWRKKNNRPAHYAAGNDRSRPGCVSAYRKHARHGRAQTG